MTPHAADVVDTSTASLIAQVADARAQHTPLRIVGSGTWSDAGRPVAATHMLSLADHSGVIEYVPSDLVLTVRSGTTLAAVQAITGEHGQWLALDPAGSMHGTIGATVATASSGPLSLSSGTVRDLVLGLGVVSGLGTRIRIGGRVVKNVAGFDLVRLNTGAWGTLGVISDVSLRLHARPAVDASFALVHDDVLQLLNIVAALKHDALALHALELLNPDAARSVGLSGTAWVLLARATGNGSAVTAQRASLASLGQVDDIDGNVWTRMRAMDDGMDVLRVSGRISTIADTLAIVHRACAVGSLLGVRLRITPHRGSVRVLVPRSDVDVANVAIVRHAAVELHAEDMTGNTPDTQLAAQNARMVALLTQLIQETHRTIGERLPHAAWRVLPAPTRDVISTRIRDAFDPDRIMNHGILGEQDT